MLSFASLIANTSLAHPSHAWSYSDLLTTPALQCLPYVSESGHKRLACLEVFDSVPSYRRNNISFQILSKHHLPGKKYSSSTVVLKTHCPYQFLSIHLAFRFLPSTTTLFHISFYIYVYLGTGSY